MAVNFGAKILNNALSAIRAQQAVIAATSSNIANVNTPGYSRRTIQLETNVERGAGAGLNVGNGVSIGGLTRLADEFLETALRDAGGEKARTAVEDDFTQRINSLFSLRDDTSSIGKSLGAFFDSLQTLALNPSSLELRANVLERGTDLVTDIKHTYSELAKLQDEADLRLGDEVNSINSLTAQIADLNGKVVAREGATGQVAADERDKRTTLLQRLSEKLGFKTIEVSDGSVTVYLENGFSLVDGTHSRNLELTKSPSFASGSPPPSLSGGILSSIVYDYDSGAGTAHVDFTSSLSQGSGTIGGLLRLRGVNDVANTSAFDADGTIVGVASRVEALTRQLLTTFNDTYLGPDRDSGSAGRQASSGDLDGDTPAVFGLFDFTSALSKDVDADGVPEISDLTSSSLGIDNYSSILKLAISQPKDFAAARDASAGAPSPASFPTGDGQNAEAVAALRTATLTSITVGSYSSATSFDGIYQDAVSYVGNASSRTQLNRVVAEDNYTTSSNRRDEVSAVSLDEEFTNLIKYQKSFEAAARLVKTVDQLLDQLVQLI